MAVYQHPGELKFWQRFSQGRNILLGTSRAVNSAWYQEALELEFQVHLRTDGVRFDCLIRNRRSGEWEAGPAFDASLLGNEDGTLAFADRLVDLAEAAGSKSLGVVLHYAEDIATAELKKELDLKENLAGIRGEIEADPKAVIADNSVSIEDDSWRVIPYAGPTNSATAIGISRRWSPFLEVMRNAGIARNFPIVTQALSSPLVSLLSLEEFKRDELAKPFVAIIPYPRFTVIGFFDLSGSLLLLRSVQHRGQRSPVNLRQVLASTAASLEMIEPEIHFIPVDAASEQQVAEELGVVPQFGSQVSEVPGVFRHTNTAQASGRPLPLEFRVVSTLDVAPGTPLGDSRTFSAFRKDGWVTQDFLPAAIAAREIYPSRAEMQLLRIARQLRAAFFLIASCSLLYFGKNIVQMVRSPEWFFKEQEGVNLKQRQMMVGQQRDQIQYWDNLLDDRSRGWATLELLPRLASNPADMLIKGFAYSAAPTSAMGQARLGFVKEWKISGFTTAQELGKMTHDDIAAIFNQIADDTGCQSFRSDLPTRTLIVNVKNQENPAYRKPVPNSPSDNSESAFPRMFDLTITQRFENNDPSSLNTGKSP